MPGFNITYPKSERDFSPCICKKFNPHVLLEDQLLTLTPRPRLHRRLCYWNNSQFATGSEGVYSAFIAIKGVMRTVQAPGTSIGTSSFGSYYYEPRYKSYITLEPR